MNHNWNTSSHSTFNVFLLHLAILLALSLTLKLWIKVTKYKRTPVCQVWQTVPRRAADGTGAVEICKPESSCSQAVKVWSEWTGVSVTAQVPETQIICKKQDEVRRWSSAGTDKPNIQNKDPAVTHPASFPQTAYISMEGRRNGHVHKEEPKTNVTCFRKLSSAIDVTRGSEM